MKKQVILFSLLVSIISALLPMTATAQQPGEEYAIFNWQNNGDFNAFLNCDVDSITYSKVDLNGHKHANVVVQEVWTPDSVYRIPIATIDSVAFRAPEPVLKDGIFRITEWHFPYVIDVNDSTALTITFNASIPSDSLPSVGQVIITDVYEGLLESGFAGRVIRTVRNGNNVLVECEEVALDDVYELLVCVGKSESFIDEDSPAGAPKRIHFEQEGVLNYEISRWNTKIVDVEGEDWSGNVELTVTPSISLDYAICYNVKGKENHFKCVVSPILDIDFDSNWKVSKSDSLPKHPKDFAFVNIPTKVPGLVAKIGVSSFLKWSGSAELDVKVPLRIQANAGYDSWRKNDNKDPFFVDFHGTGIRNIDGNSQGKLHLKLDGSVFTGLWLNFTVFFLHESVANAKIGLKAGPKLSATLDFNNDLTHLPSWYDFKDTKVSIEPLVAQLTASVKTLFSEELPWSSPQWSVFGSKDYYLFPNFTAPALRDLSENNYGYSLTALTSDIKKFQRNLLFPVKPGIRIVKNNQEYTYLSDSTYRKWEKWDNRFLQMELNGTYPSPEYPIGTYTAKPVFEFFGNTIEASPISTVTIPDTMKVESAVNVKVEETQNVSFTGGWGDYDISNSASSVCIASITGKKIKITGRKKGTAILTLTDNRSKESKKINVTVYETAQPPTIMVTPDEYNFGTVIKENTDSKTFTVTCSNVTDGVSISRSGNTGMFSVTNNTDATGNGTFTVTYKPTATGTHKMTLYIKCAFGPSDTVTVTGKCVNPSINVTPKSLNFGTVLLGDSITKTFTVTGTDLVGNLTLRSTNSSRFKLNGNKSTITLTPNANGAINQQVTVTYKPTQAQNNGGYIVINGTGIANDTVRLSGKCVVPSLSVNPNSLNFGTVVKNYTRSMELTVTGSYLTSGLTVSSSNSAVFSVSPSTITASEANAGKTVTITYKPTAVGSHSATITISGGDATSVTVPISGTCEEGYITVTPTKLDFGSLAPGQSKTMWFTVSTNVPGALKSNYTETVLGEFTVPTSITGAGSYDVTFNPDFAGSYGGVINIMDPKSGASARVAFEGKCVPTINVSPESWSAKVVKGYTSTKTFTVTTTGFASNKTLTLSSSNSNFKLNKTSLGASGGSFVVTYEPEAVGSHSGTITVSCGDVSKTVSVSGVCEAGYITVTPTKLDFGSLAPGQSKTMSFTVSTNVPGALKSNYTETVLGEFTVPTSITGAGSYDVTFNPDFAGSYGGVINIMDPKSGASARVAFEGKCVAPTITVEPTSLTFKIDLSSGGYSDTKTFIVKGTNLTGPLKLELEGQQPGKYSITPSTITAAEAAAGKTVRVTYSSNVVGTHRAFVGITGGGANSKTVNLTGITAYGSLN